MSKHSCSCHSPMNQHSKTIASLYVFFLCREGSGESVHRHNTEISCAGSNSDSCVVYKDSECCGEAKPATTTHLGNHQCVVSMRQKMLPVRCNKLVNRTLVSLPRKKHEVVIVFYDITCKYDNSLLRYAYSPHFRQLHWKQEKIWH